MNPHFIFNVLTSIQNYQLRGDTRKAGIFLAKFGKVIRRGLEYSREELITLTEEKALLEDYLEVQKALNDEVFDYEIHVAPDLDPDQVKVPPMFAQPFIENAIEHGQLSAVEEGRVKIVFEREDHLLQLKIDDNGVGIDESVKTGNHKKSLSTTITRERLALLEKRFGLDLYLQLDLPNQPHHRGTVVTMALPFIQ